MPIYDFRCRECGKVSEILFRDISSRNVHCPDCGSENVEKLLSSSYIVKAELRSPGTTCCGRTERCEAPPCSTGDVCRKK